MTNELGKSRVSRSRDRPGGGGLVTTGSDALEKKGKGTVRRILMQTGQGDHGGETLV